MVVTLAQRMMWDLWCNGPAALIRAALLISALSTLGCATIPAGSAGVVFTASGVEPQAIGEGMSYVGPLAEVTVYDVRSQERNENLLALAADGAVVQTNASLVSFHVEPSTLPLLERETGPDYYEVLVRPIVQSAVRRILARYSVFDLTTNNIIEMEKEIARSAAVDLAPHYIVLEGLDLRTVTVRSPPLWTQIENTSVWEQYALAAPQRLDLARARAKQLQEAAGAVAQGHITVAPTLTGPTLAERRSDAWTQLLQSRNTSVEVQSSQVPPLVEVQP